MTRAAEHVECYTFSPAQLAEFLGVGLRTVQRLRVGGRLPGPQKLGGAVRWSREEIRDWFDAGSPDRKTWEALKEMRARRRRR